MNTFPFISYLAQCVRFHRKKSGLTQAELAKFAGLGKTVIFDIEQGKSSIQLDTLLKIFHVLNISIHLDSPLIKSFGEIYHETS